MEGGVKCLDGLVYRLLHYRRLRPTKNRGHIHRSDTVHLSPRVPSLIHWSLHQLSRKCFYPHPLITILLLHQFIQALIHYYRQYAKTHRVRKFFSTHSPGISNPYCDKPLRQLPYPFSPHADHHPDSPAARYQRRYHARYRNHDQVLKTMKKASSPTSVKAYANKTRTQPEDTKEKSQRPLKPLPRHPPHQPQRHSLNLTPRDLFSRALRSSLQSTHPPLTPPTTPCPS